ncbi:MAG: nucleotide sugar dehydrogenase [Betaproteobacteria bacterium]|nr:nucleotide sugar dehydrogenase [Gammaproteobacteria bacterium]MDH3436812.1 nucleotide sugar dehydrogenase [Betaproteobacteria bacterium]
MKISIFGLGYVGAVSLACLARDGHTVIGVDVDPAKLELIRSGKTPVVEEGMVDLVAEVAASGRVSVTTDVIQAVRGSDLSLICVGTPSAPNGSQDQSAILHLAHDLGKATRGKDARHVFVFRSTLVPGTVEDVLRPILEQASDKKDGRDFDVCFQPEFLREGSSIRDYDRPPFTVVGANAEAPADRLRELFGHLPCEFYTTSIRAAEMVKYCCNNFHALKITFANEIARLCEALGVDAFQVMDLVCKDRQLNISPAYLKPGFAFGGSCLPKDLRATLYLGKTRDVELPMLANVLQSNRVHVEHAIAKVLASGRRRVGMIGLSFKTGTDDLRESPLVLIAEQFIGKGLRLLVYDPEVHLSRLLGANRRFIEQHVPHIGSLMREDIESVIGESDVLVVGLSDTQIFEALARHVREDQLVLDLVNIPQREALRGKVVGLCW